MTEFNRPNAPMENSPKDAVRLIADSALQSGITLIGGLMGSGKLQTTDAVIQSIKKNNNFNSNHLFYLNTIEENEAGRNIRTTVNALVDKHEGSHLLVILDEISNEINMAVALGLARLGHSVLGVTECLRPISLASVLKGAIVWTGDDHETALTANLLENLNMIALQNSMTTHTTCSLTYRDKHDFVTLLNTHGIDRVSEELNAIGVSHV